MKWRRPLWDLDLLGRVEEAHAKLLDKGGLKCGLSLAREEQMDWQLSVDVTQSLQDLETLDESKFYGCQPPLYLCVHASPQRVCMCARDSKVHIHIQMERKKESQCEREKREERREGEKLARSSIVIMQVDQLE